MQQGDEVIIEAWHVRVWQRYRESWLDKQIRFSTGVGLIAFALSVAVSLSAIAYATARASNSVTDIILSNVPIFDVDGIMVAGTLLLIIVITLLLLHHPKRLPFGLDTLALFFFIRSAFTVATHVAAYPIPVANTPDLNTAVGKFVFGFGGDLFFSAHTAVPFLMALLFWENLKLRYLFLLWSVFFGVVVLLGHLHYTIDVFAAYFITYGIYKLAVQFFPQAYAYWFAAE